MATKKKIAIIGTGGVPARYGGFETLVEHLVVNLNQEFDLYVYASTKLYSKKERVKKWNNANMYYLPLSANGISSILYDLISMIHAMFFADQILLLGVSAGIFTPIVKWFSKTKLIVNIDGLEWRREKWNKWVQRFLHFSEKTAVRFSDADITDNEAIKRYTAIYYKTASHLIAYGADHVTQENMTNNDVIKYPFLSSPYAFKVARIEPENNLSMVLETFSKTPSKTLVIVGNWAKSQYGITLKETYQSFKNIHLLDPIYNQKELNKLRANCFVYIHGHSAGGTNPSLVEAMYLNLPILSFDVSYNRATTSNQCLYFKDVNELQYLLENTSYTTLRKIGKEMGHIARFRYTWKYISNRYGSIFKAFDYNYKKPELKNAYQQGDYNKLVHNGYAHLSNTKLFYQNTNN
ncbi:DUF1972 domain-containing protein [Wenyingzhuangia aestuarii]|uniref:DUF1972 domain-containing protein n=1 Tax=Wenyingzhuangia aestuarii TaxID=1647582 RepID=UPI00143C5B00|nr:DUF1972 domain-containing protein [Wenyingzhuangia aestuarii]NJB82466.1 glycosyltransferase involved in cell wall biosynthesis [Wenyingzhuangia aestuarii]